MTIQWIQKATVLAIHQAQLVMHGGLAGVRDMALVDSALARPKNLYAYAEGGVSLHQLAVSYAVGLSANHPFVDGNKRVALVTAYVFLELNGVQVTASEGDSVTTFLGLAANEVTEEALVTFLRSNSQEIS